MDTTRETLILKWLDGSLTEAEQKAFENLEDYNDLMRLSKTAKLFKAPSFDTDVEYETLKKNLIRKPKVRPLWQPLFAIASILIVAVAVYLNVFYNPLTTIKTGFAQTQDVTLPNGSLVNLNADSKLIYDEARWDTERKLKLQGEAFFNVTKGAKFSVETPLGTVTVLGTQFNVIQRDNWFEVACYEGLVQVTTKLDTVNLPPQRTFKIIDGIVSKGVQFSKSADWLMNQSKFSGIPYAYVLAELERQYNVTIESKGIDTNKTFTGAFTHDNLNQALTTITQPMRLSYSVKGNTVTLTTID